jgi:hypothetical protein
MNYKRIIKIILGIIIFMTLPSLLLFGYVYYKYNEDLPTGVKGEEAELLATKMLNALDHQAYESTNLIEWTFKKRHHYKWKKNEYKCTVQWEDYKVELNFKDTSLNKAYIHNFKVDNDKAKELIQKATDYFNNDSFWLAAPYKVFDEGTERQIVTLDSGKQGLLVTYTSGGSTPGDSYLWLLDDNYKPKAFKMWTSILPIQGLEASWTDWTVTESKAQLPTFHKLIILGIELNSVKGKN